MSAPKTLLPHQDPTVVRSLAELARIDVDAIVGATDYDDLFSRRLDELGAVYTMPAAASRFCEVAYTAQQAALRAEEGAREVLYAEVPEVFYSTFTIVFTGLIGQ